MQFLLTISMNRFDCLEHTERVESPSAVSVLANGTEDLVEKEQLAGYFANLRENKDSFEAELIDKKTYFVLQISCRSLTCGPYEEKFPIVRTTLRFPKNKQLFYAVMDGVAQLPEQARVMHNSKGLAHYHVTKYREDLKTEALRRPLAEAKAKVLHEIARDTHGVIGRLMEARKVADQVITASEQPLDASEDPQENLTVPLIIEPQEEQKNAETQPVVQEAKVIREFRQIIALMEDTLAGTQIEQPKQPLSGLGSAFLTFMVQGCKSFFLQKTTNIPALTAAQRQIEAKLLPWFRGPSAAVSVVVSALWARVKGIFTHAAEKGKYASRDSFFSRLETLRQNRRASYQPSAGMPRITEKSQQPAMPRPVPQPPLEIFTDRPTLAQKITQRVSRLRRWGQNLFVPQ